jgi:putative FmdB family regulatory protein
MPIYEYECNDCGEEFEKLMRFSDPNINTPECPGCKSRHTHRRISRVASFGNTGSGSSSGSSCGSSGGFS